MASIGNTGRLEAFRGSLFNYGLALIKCDIRKALGVWKAAEAATIRQGQFVMLDANGELVLTDGRNVHGVAKWNKMTLGQAVITDEPISFAVSGGTATLKKTNTVSAVHISSAVQGQGTQYVGAGTDYTAASNGVVTHNGGGAIPVGTVVYATYTFQMTALDHANDGTNFLGSQDDVTLHENRLTVITDWSLLFTAEFDTSRQYSLSGAGANLYVTGPTYANGGAGILTNLAPTDMDPGTGNGVGRFVGRVTQLPTASDGFLGIMLGGNPTAFQPAGAPPASIAI